MSLRIVAFALALAAGSVTTARAGVPANPYNYTRTVAYTYDPTTNQLLTQTREPSNLDSCVLTTYHYDANGNPDTVTATSCAGASTSQQFATAANSANYAAPASQTITVNGSSVSVGYASGLFATTEQNALQQTDTKQFDPRFGAVLQDTDPNQLATKTVVDDFGRKTKETYADGTSTVWYYCWISAADTSSNTPGCSTLVLKAGEAPADAVAFVHSERHNTQGAKMGPFQRSFTDKLGRVIRTSTEGFDGPSQPGAVQGAVVVQDTVYNAYGQVALKTQPYFLQTGASTTSDSAKVGVTLTLYDAIRRPSIAYVADPNGHGGTQTFGGAGGVAFGAYGARTAAVTTYQYQGLKQTATTDLNQVKTVEKDLSWQPVRITDPAGAQLAYQRDAFGNLVATKDALQNTITMTYDIVGRMVQKSDPDAGLWLYCYDALGELTAQQSPLMRGTAAPGACPGAPNSGTVANQVPTWTTFAYDALRRTTQRAEPEYVTTWSYDQCTMGVGKLCDANTSNGTDRQEVYDAFGRPINELSTFTGSRAFANAVGYDPLTGRVSSRTYPTGLQVGYAYTSLGFVNQLLLNTAATVNPLPSSPRGQPGPSVSLSAGTVLWQAQAVNAWGDVEQEAFGNGVISQVGYDALTHRPSNVSASSGSLAVANLGYAWDSVGRMTGRTDYVADGSGNQVSETFNYTDPVDRLTGYSVSAPAIPGMTRNVALQYNALSMLLYKSDVGNYTYGAQGPTATQPHALLSVAGAVNTSFSYDADGNLINSTGTGYQAAGYTSFDLPGSPISGSTTGLVGSGSNPNYRWGYDDRHARVMELRRISSGVYAGTRTTWFVHPDNQGGLGFESEVNSPTIASASNPAVTSNRHFLTVNGQVIGVLVSTGDVPTLASGQTAPPTISAITLVKVEYWQQDYLGSLVATTDHAGAVTARYAYEPFGKRRNTDGEYDSTNSIVVDWSPAVNYGTGRGFTGHEHMDAVGLIHMNGRIYDPTIAAFLQVDPHLSDPGNLRNYNGYAYCLESPLSCADPSGFDDVQTITIVGNRPGLDSMSPGFGGNLIGGGEARQTIVIVGQRIKKTPPSAEVKDERRQGSFCIPDLVRDSIANGLGTTAGALAQKVDWRLALALGAAAGVATYESDGWAGGAVSGLLQGGVVSRTPAGAIWGAVGGFIADLDGKGNGGTVGAIVGGAYSAIFTPPTRMGGLNPNGWASLAGPTVVAMRGGLVTGLVTWGVAASIDFANAKFGSCPRAN